MLNFTDWCFNELHIDPILFCSCVKPHRGFLFIIQQLIDSVHSVMAPCFIVKHHKNTKSPSVQSCVQLRFSVSSRTTINPVCVSLQRDMGTQKTSMEVLDAHTTKITVLPLVHFCDLQNTKAGIE